MCGYIYHFVLLMGWCVCGGCAVGIHETNHDDGFSRAPSMEILSLGPKQHTRTAATIPLQLPCVS